MSEIFNWLKRSELEKKQGSSDSLPIESTLLFNRVDGASPDSLPISIPVPNFDFSPPAEPEPAMSDDNAAHARADVEMSLNLKLADYRVKDVWDPVTLVGEQFRLLRTKLALMQKQRGIRTLLVTSAIPAEGKTFVSCGLAGVLAQQPGKRALLIDSDLRKPMAAQDLGMNDFRDLQGLSEVLAGKAQPMDVLLSSKESNMFFMHAGKNPDNPAELLSSPILAQTLKTLADTFDWVVIDSPPAFALADSSILASLCDAIVLVVHSSRTSSTIIKESIERLGRDKICGIIMNRSSHIKASRYYYSYYYKHARQ
jgi:capsular exopolysaccharide synthesis family protein